MTFQMIDTDHRNTQAVAQCFGIIYPHQKRAGQSWSVSDRDCTKFIFREV